MMTSSGIRSEVRARSTLRYIVNQFSRADFLRTYTTNALSRYTLYRVCSTQRYIKWRSRWAGGSPSLSRSGDGGFCASGLLWSRSPLSCWRRRMSAVDCNEKLCLHAALLSEMVVDGFGLGVLRVRNRWRGVVGCQRVVGRMFIGKWVRVVCGGISVMYGRWRVCLYFLICIWFSYNFIFVSM